LALTGSEALVFREGGGTHVEAQPGGLPRQPRRQLNHTCQQLQVGAHSRGGRGGHRLRRWCRDGEGSHAWPMQRQALWSSIVIQLGDCLGLVRRGGGEEGGQPLEHMCAALQDPVLTGRETCGPTASGVVQILSYVLCRRPTSFAGGGGRVCLLQHHGRATDRGPALVAASVDWGRLAEFTGHRTPCMKSCRCCCSGQGAQSMQLTAPDS
jgi:hypothetical protein